MFSAPHSATLRGKRQNFTLAYDAGTAVFHAGATLTGATSHATAVIVSTGSIASGSLQLHIFQGFNLLDAIAIDKDFSAKLADIDSSISKLDTQFTIFQVFCLFFCFVMAAVFVFLIIIVDISEHKYKLDHAKS